MPWRKTIKLMTRLTIKPQSTQQKNCNKDLPKEGVLACLGGSSVVEELFCVSVLPSIFAPPLSSSSTCPLHISCMGQGIFNAFVILTVNWCVTSVLTSFPCASAAHHLSVSSALLSVFASLACFPVVFLLGYWAWSQLEALGSPFSKEAEF